MTDRFAADHPARSIPSLAGVVLTIEEDLDETRFRGSPFAAQRAALNAAHTAYQTGRHDAIRELITTEHAAGLLGVTMPQVRRIAEKLGVGWHLEKTVWLFTPDDIAAMGARKTKRGPEKRNPDGNG